ncbi:hypothetical protein GCM10023334_005830 [Nonomuraea thailandensis]
MRGPGGAAGRPAAIRVAERGCVPARAMLNAPFAVMTFFRPFQHPPEKITV